MTPGRRRQSPSLEDRAAACSYLLRVSITSQGRRFLLQDLRTAERHQFTSEAALRRFLRMQRPDRLR